MSLTLIEVVTAASLSKNIQYAMKGFVWDECDARSLTIGEIGHRLKEGDFRIKPEPQDLWIVSWPHSLCSEKINHDVFFSEPETIPRGARVIHAKEVLE